MTKEEKAAYMREYNSKRTPEQRAESNLWTKWRLKMRDYKAILKSQGGGCAICGVKEDPCKAWQTGNPRLMAVDHVHGSDPVDIRGILCTKCNTFIGYAREHEEILNNAIHYINDDLHKIKEVA